MSLYIWGTGCGAAELFEKGLDPDMVSAFVESRPEKAHFMGKAVLRPEELSDKDCDLVIVSTRHSGEILERCRALGIGEEKLLFTKNSVELRDRNEKCSAEKLLGEELYSRLRPGFRLVREADQLRNKVAEGGDYVRLATLRLLSERVGGLKGAAAELGVFRGEFAKEINRLLPARKLYLFDSFQGFEAESGAGDAFQAAHESSTAAKVLSLMPHPEMVRIRKGFFPSSLDGLEESFCFVSLDVDFYAATLEGLRYFWPRLVKGGYIMLHDWGSEYLRGVSAALADYEIELGEKLPSFPLCDIGSSLILTKI